MVRLLDAFNSGAGLFMRLYHNWNTGDFATVQAADPVNDHWYHAFVAVNRDGTAYMYINGELSGSASFSTSAANSITSDVSLTIGSISFGQANAQHSEYGGKVAYVAMWKQSAWMSASPQTELDALVKDRFVKMLGLYPQLAGGTATPILASSPLTASLENGITTYLVGEDWFRSNNTGSGDSGALFETTQPDVLIYDAPGNISASVGSVSCEYYIQSGSATPADNRYLFSAHSGSNDYINIYMDTSYQPVAAVSSNGIVSSVTGSTVMNDGVQRELKLNWQSGSMSISVDGTVEDTGTCIPPLGLSEINVGSNASGLKQLHGLIRNLKIRSLE